MGSSRAQKGFKRKLATILNSHVEGYSRLVDDNEEMTVRRLLAYRDKSHEFQIKKAAN